MGDLISAITRWGADAVRSSGYVGVFFVVAFGSAIDLPVPTELTLPFIGFLVGRGRLSFVPALLTASAGRVAASLVLYHLGLRIGEERLRRLAKRTERFGLLFRSDLDKASGFFERHGGEAVLIGQLVPGVGAWVSLAAGVGRMAFRQRFIGYTVLGSALWSGSLIALGWALGREWSLVERYASIVGYAVLAVAVAGALWFLWRRWRRPP